MPLSCGIVGIKRSGKTTLFNCMTKNKVNTGTFDDTVNIANINVPDRRIYELSKIQETQKLVFTSINVIDIPGFDLKQTSTERKVKILSTIRNCDLLIHVVRCFENDLFPHPMGTINPIRDVEEFELELQSRDLESVLKKIQKTEKIYKSGNKELKKQIEILEKVKHGLENFVSVRNISLSENELKYISDLFLLTEKKVLYVANVNADDIELGNNYSRQISEYLKAKSEDLIILSAQIEAEIAELTNDEERIMFLKDYGIEEAAIDKVIRKAYELLGLLTFFTIGPKEIRAWTIKKGTTAQQAAGVIHSDLEKGFIRAEVMKYEDFIEYKGEQGCKEKGRFFIEGKNYIVQDGDILHIRFNV
ncbi:MAG: redox-regulated ATPase YchF [Bacteroidales bacterium]|nr:redox-regulated ATPase YchF [Bacteroidales bacterium]